MKAVTLQGYGDVDQFKLVDVPAPQPKTGEILIDAKASGLNPVDLYVRQGFMKDFMPLSLPAIIGIDVAGTVKAVGAGVSGFAVGDRVVARLPITGQGAHAQETVAPVAVAAKLPANLSFEQGATLPLASLTAQSAIAVLGVKRGDRVLISGALGAVGRAVVRYLKALGAVPVAGVRASRLGEARSLAGEAIDIEGQPTPVFDYAVSAAAPVAGAVVAFVRDGGTIASVVQTPSHANPGDRVNIVQVMAQDDGNALEDAVAAASRGELDIPIAQTFPLAELAAAHRVLAAGPHGKIIIKH